MHYPRSTNLTEETFIALMDALGFTDAENPQLKEEHPAEVTFVNSKPTMDLFPSAFDDAAYIRQEYLSEYDFGSDLDEDSSDYGDTLPSRPCSRFDTVYPSTMFSSQLHQSAKVHPAMARPAPRPAAPLPPSARPLALYLPDGVPFPALTEIHSPTSSTLSYRDSRSDESSLLSDLDSLRSTPDSTVYTQEGTVYIKAAFNATIIMIRASQLISFVELKQKLYDKFVKQEGIPLFHSFSVVSVRPPSISFTDRTAWSNNPRGLGRCHSGSGVPIHPSSIKRTSSVEPRRISFAERTEMHFIDDEADWRRVLAVHRADGSKITLRILDTPN